MRSELSILSFTSAILLIALFFLHAKSRNVAVLALIGWLLVCSVVQGVNSVVWTGNAADRAPVWCDIVTKLLLGSRIALPAASTCICFHLHFLASSRGTRQRTHRKLFELTFCLILPLIFMALHTINQDHRFDLAQDFGCASSTYFSAPAIILVWIPPLLFCITTVIFAGLALWSHVHRHPLHTDHAFISSRLVTVTFLRPLLTAIIIATIIFVISIFDLYLSVSISRGVRPWVSLATVHSKLSQPHVVPSSSRLELARIEVWWWVTPAATLLFAATALIGLIYCLQTDPSYGRRSVGRWFRSTILRQPGANDEFIQSSEGYSTRFTIISPSSLAPSPVPDSLVSGWDDSLRPSKTKTKPKPAPIICPLPPVSPSPSESESGSESSFRSGSLRKMRSPSPREGGGRVVSPVISPPPQAVTADARWSTLLVSEPPGISSAHSASPTHSILTSPWPVPPSTVPVSPIKSPVRSPHKSPVKASPTKTSTTTLLTATAAPILSTPPHRPIRPQTRPPSISSLTTSLSSSTISASAYLPDPDLFLHSVSPPSRMPFQDSGVPAPEDFVPPPLARTATTGRAARRVPSVESLGRSRSLGQGSAMLRKPGRLAQRNEAIYMTVVQETQDV